MNHWSLIRQIARRRHQEIQALSADVTAAALVKAAEKHTGISLVPVPAEDPLLDGGEAALVDGEFIFYNADVDPHIVPFLQAHEFAHFWLHDQSACCVASDFDSEVYEEPLPIGIQRVEAYSPQERQEREANVFAREFLLPSDVIRRWYLDEGLRASEIAARTGLPIGLVFHQLAHALLIGDFDTDAAGEEQEGSTAIELDRSQKKAAHTSQGPFLLDAGPGTGKTRALVGRVVHLLAEGVAPESILALTFSNKAAEEMRLRVAQVAPDAAPRIWMGTFHAFGLELLRKHGERLELPIRVSVIDPVDAVLLLERELQSLGLEHYQNLYEPTINLRHILQAISRAKDECIDPETYRSFAERMLDDSRDDEERASAENAIEVARVYARYEELLQLEEVLDFGDLIFRSVDLLQEYPDVRQQLRHTYQHILVDEYQDVNRASGMLLRELAGDGRGLWVVGDVRQSIYRFRGAAPHNMRLFDEDFPGAARGALHRNYRSQPAIVDLVSALGSCLQAAEAEPSTSWEAVRPDDGGRVAIEIADDPETEAQGIATAITSHLASGVSYRDQAVLCRSHSQLARIASMLERDGIPALYLGSLFERPGVRDLLVVLSMMGEAHGRGLMRVAQFPEYLIPLADVRALLSAAARDKIPFPKALDIADDLQELSPQGRSAIDRLREHLGGFGYGTNPWWLLVHYLFERSRYIDTILHDDSPMAQQERLAIYQLVQLAYERRAALSGEGRDSKRAFLDYIRTIETFRESKTLRQLPDWAESIDAVRLLTIHASKGLQFPVVYVPSLGAGMFPANRRHNPCPLPVGIVSEADGHDEEEECLFFVALSRAEDMLCLSRPAMRGVNRSNPSSLLRLIAHHLPDPIDGEVTWLRRDSEEFDELLEPFNASRIDDNHVFNPIELEVYGDCPRKYLYEFVLGLGGQDDMSGYVRFHRCISRVIHWLHDEWSKGNEIDIQEARERLSVEWETDGPIEHPYEQMYREAAEDLLASVLQRRPTTPLRIERPSWEISLSNGRLRLIPDSVEVDPTGVGQTVVRRFRTGRLTKSEQDKDIYALYLTAVQQVVPSADIEISYLGTNETQRVEMTDRKVRTRLRKYEDAIDGIRGNQFPPNPDDHSCPRCPYYFICPVLPCQQ